MSDEIEVRRPVPAPLIHPMSALITLALDYIFAIPELLETIAPPILVLTSLGVGLIGAVASSLIQHYIAKDEWGPSVAKGVFMGIFAGVPYPVASTLIGAPLLVWAGLHQWIKLPPPKEQDQLPPPEE